MLQGAARSFGAQDTKTTVSSRRGGNELRWRGSGGGTGHHRLGSTIASVRRAVILSRPVHVMSSGSLAAMIVAVR